MIRVYYASPSIYGRKVLAALEEKGLDYEIEKMSFSTQDHLKPEYLKINPNGEIPAIQDDETVIYESTAIIEYLNDEYPEPPLMPEDSASRAQVRMVEDFCDLHVYPAIVKCLIKKVFKKEELTDADKAPVIQAFKRLENYLGSKSYVAGNSFSLADCAVMAAVATLDSFPALQSSVTYGRSFQNYVNGLKKRPGYKGASVTASEPAAAAQA